MNNYNELESIISEIENGFSPVESLLSNEFRDAFKLLMLESGDVASMLESLKDKNSPIANDSKDILDIATNIVFRIHKISPDDLSVLCKNSGFNDGQLLQITETCIAREKASEKSICYLFESHALDISLINYHKVGDLLRPKLKDNNNEKQTLKSENTFDAFVRYLINSGAPSVILEELARLTVYQKQQFQDDLKVNFKFKKIYETYVETSVINTDEIQYAKGIVEQSILKNLRDYPIQILSVNGGIPLAKYGNPSKITDSFITSRAPATFLDGWGVKDGNLLGYCVTNKYTFDDQDIQIINDAHAIENGLLKGELQGITNYQLIGLCKPLLSDDNENYVSFGEQIKRMLKNGELTKEEYVALKYAPVHKETLKILDNTSDDLYEKIRHHIALGFHTDNTISVRLKGKQLQTDNGIYGVCTGISALRKIIKSNPTLHQIDTAFCTYAKDLSSAFSLANSAKINVEKIADKSEILLQQCEDDLIFIQDKLIESNSRNAQDFKIETNMKSAVIARKKKYNQAFSDQQSALINNTVSLQEDLKLKTGVSRTKHNENAEASKVSGRSNILLGNETSGTITTYKLCDTLIFSITELHKRQLKSKETAFHRKHGTSNLHKGTFNQIVKGLNQSTEKDFDLTTLINEYDCNVIHAINNYDVDGVNSLKERMIRNDDDEKLTQKTLIVLGLASPKHKM